MENIVKKYFKNYHSMYDCRWKPYTDLCAYLDEHILCGDGHDVDENRDYYLARVAYFGFPGGGCINYAIVNTISGSLIKDAMLKETRSEKLNAIRRLNITDFSYRGPVSDDNMLVFCNLFDTKEEAQTACNLFNKALEKNNKKNLASFCCDKNYYKKCLLVSEELSNFYE